jgi:DNA-directed RNA polymerase, mitochondrial
MLALVDRFAVDVMDHKGEQREDDRCTVSADLRIANWIGARSFYLDYSCDSRGRLYALQHFNYGREDYVRSLFRFANGQRLARAVTGRAVDWLEIHCANCEGSTDKKPWAARQQWVAENRDRIEKITADPFGTFKLWNKDSGVDKPFAFVAACIELANAWANPEGFETHLPIAFDGSCNGLQHLAMLCRDREAGKRVNLLDTDSPQDIYSDVTAYVLTELETDPSDLATWWRNRLKPLDPKKKRKLLKAPVMTLAYNVKDDGMIRQMSEAYAGFFDGNEPTSQRARFLAKKVRKACEKLLPGPAAVMRYITALTRECNARECFLEWTTPTGFPVSNRYYQERLKTIYLVRHGERIRHQVAYELPKIDKTRTANSAPANFIHSLDAAHLVRVVNAAMAEDISDIVCVHDSFACLATQAVRFNRIIRTQLAMLHARQDHLLALGEQYGIAPPPYGDLDPLDVQNAEYCFA